MEDEDEHVRDSAYYALEAGQIRWFLWFFLWKGGTKIGRFPTQTWRSVFFCWKKTGRITTRVTSDCLLRLWAELRKYLGGRVWFLCGCSTTWGSKKASWIIRFNCRTETSHLCKVLLLSLMCVTAYIQVLKARKRKRACISSRKHISTKKTHNQKQTRLT